ncbi:hypothetical protein ACN08P_20930 [Photobacterium leiognathi subsp. mandapamensis]|uniref:hypothetical protein n=1 Tax=Photobacterium leiognathi TaxID=553611 RepID=UPI003AF343F6
MQALAIYEGNMSVIRTYETPSDLFMKLIREGRRTWCCTQLEDKADHFFNFCITSLSLRDWCIEELKLTGKDKDDFFKLHSSNEWLNYCGSIANSSKHFALKAGRKSAVSSVNNTVDSLVPIFPDGAWHDEVKIERVSFEITTSDGESKGLMLLLFFTCYEWEKIFDQYSIRRPHDNIKVSMFVEMYYPS